MSLVVESFSGMYTTFFSQWVCFLIVLLPELDFVRRRYNNLVLSAQEISLMTVYLKTDLSTPANYPGN